METTNQGGQPVRFDHLSVTRQLAGHPELDSGQNHNFWGKLLIAAPWDVYIDFIDVCLPCGFWFPQEGIEVVYFVFTRELLIAKAMFASICLLIEAETCWRRNFEGRVAAAFSRRRCSCSGCALARRPWRSWKQGTSGSLGAPLFVGVAAQRDRQLEFGGDQNSSGINASGADQSK